ncbi:amino acid adenylation domain-containing protein [Corynebacterium sp. P7003]|uniref:Amino acid adenylation domain-containing protein n=1 Tax=Corynebacterium pygosceleis TaxID=2800406 RepID=A0ABT3WRV4_9CORY|nr:amino acid adenylation domain-containing protein [Corynebacterium pygosceleis]MCX7444977.1 amino acid adenylation domain-containing protein [Corynebacterium pygosceleis]
MNRGVSDVLALSPLQEGLYAAASGAVGGAGDLYTVQLAMAFAGPLDPRRLHQAVTLVVERNPHLDARFTSKNLPHPVALVPAEPVVDWEERTCTVEQARRLADSERLRTFDLGCGPVSAVKLCTVGPSDALLVWTMHHILIDGWSVPLLWEELRRAYTGDSTVDPVPVRPYSAWLTSRDQSDDREFWSRYLEGLDGPCVVGSPTTTGGPPEMSTQVIRGTDLERLRNGARSMRVTLGTLAQVAWALVLRRITGTPDPVFGVSVAGRPETVPDPEKMIGMFTNTIAARINTATGETVEQLCRRVQRELTVARTHSYNRLSELQQWAGVSPLFDTAVVFHNAPKGEAATAVDFGDGVTMHPVHRDSWSHFPLVLAPAEIGDELHLTVDVRTEALPSGVDGPQLTNLVRSLMDSLVAHPDRPIRGVGVEHAESRPRHHSAESSAGEGIAHVFARTAIRYAERPAVTDREGTLTYRELSCWAAHTAERLSAAGIGRGDRVAVLLPRTVAYPAALLGILSVGAVVVPLDPNAPPERNSYIMDTAQVSATVTAEGMPEIEAPSGSRLMMEGAPRGNLPLIPGELHAVTESDPAYVVFTSGSTGKPKGVVAAHKGILGLLAAHSERIWGPVSEESGGLVTGHAWSFAFDAAWQPQLALLAGGELVILDEHCLTDPAEFVRVVRAAGVEILDTSPTLVRPLIDAGLVAPGGLKVLALGAEDISVDLWRRLAETEGVAVHNFYGPTETTVEVCSARLTTDDPPNIGFPFPGTLCHVLGPDLAPVPRGFTGELYVAGDQVALSYEQQPGRTAERFVPAADGRRMYRTGDLVRVNEAGRMVFVGRADRQVKIRGFRVEPGETTAVMNSCPGVAHAVAGVVDRGGHRALMGWVVAEGDGDFDVQTVLTHCGSHLPAYMVPSVVTEVDVIPRDVNGKTDFATLESLLPTTTGGSRAVSDTEKTVHGVVCRLLHRDGDTVGTDIPFRDLGIDSIAVMGLVTALQKEGLHVSVRMINRADTIRALASAIDAGNPAEMGGDDRGKDPHRDSVPRHLCWPMLHWLADLGQIRRFAMTMVVKLPSGAERTRVADCWGRVERAHPILRSRLVRSGEGLRLEPGVGSGAEIRGIDGDPLCADTVADAVEKARQALDPEKGKMVSLVILGSGSPDPLLIAAVHHTVCDLASWHVLLGDLAAGWSGADLPAHTGDTSVFEDWISDATDSGGEESYWRSVAESVAAAQPLPVVGCAGSMGDTELLQREIPAPDLLLGARSRDTVAAAFAWAWTETVGGDPTSGAAVITEGHGRGAHLVGDRDPGDVVGWLNCLYPVVLGRGSTPPAGTVEITREDAGAWIDAVAQTLDDVPSGGLHAAACIPVTGDTAPQVMLIHLGRADTLASGTVTDAEPFTVVTDRRVVGDVDLTPEPEMRSPYPLEVSVGVQAAENGPVLCSVWRFNPDNLERCFVELLADRFMTHILALSTALDRPEGKGAD